MKTNLDQPRTSTVNHMKLILHLLWILLQVSAGAWGVLQRSDVQEHAENKCHGLLSQTTVDFRQGGEERNSLYTFHQNMGVQKFKCGTFCVCNPSIMTLCQDEVEK